MIAALQNLLTSVLEELIWSWLNDDIIYMMSDRDWFIHKFVYSAQIHSHCMQISKKCSTRFTGFFIRGQTMGVAQLAAL